MEEKEKYFFDHEKLNVYAKAVEFVEWADKLLKTISKKDSISDQLYRASESIVLNIAEGNGKFTQKDKCRYFDISRGSVFECAGCLDILFAKKLINDSIKLEGKAILKDIVNMLMGLIKSNSNRSYESDEEYNT